MNKYYIFGVAIFNNGKERISRNFVSHEAFSNWANQQFKKDESVIIDEYRFSPSEFGVKKVRTWSA